MKFSYDINIIKVRELITSAVKKVPGYLEDPAPMVTLDNADAITLWLTVYYWVDMTIAESMLKVKDTGYETITKSLAENGIEIPVSINRLGIS
jgi:small-conductance mechanosensitive channel